MQLMTSVAVLAVVVLLSVSVLSCRVVTRDDFGESAVNTNPRADITYLVFRIRGSPNEATAQYVTRLETTSTFLYQLETPTCTVEDVLGKGMYFRALEWAVGYATQNTDSTVVLEYDSLKFLSNGPGPFEEYSESSRKYSAPAAEYVPDVVYSVDQIATEENSITPMRIGRGGFVWTGPSGAVADEVWPLTGRYVYDYDAFLSELKARGKEWPMVYYVGGRWLH
jgi:hypothetical protein